MNVEDVQRRLWEQSRQHHRHRQSATPMFPVNIYDGRVRNLMDLMHHPQWLRVAAERALSRSQNKATGVDGVTASKFRMGFEGNLETLRLELKRGTYQPQPARRVMIPKANGKLRPLGIPCMRDKIVQEAIRMALEPIFEVEFHENSYGFRPNRNAHHAISDCRRLTGCGFSWVIEGDVKACFDEISHDSILKVVREKVMDNKFLTLIRRFLKAGVKVEGVVQPTEKGVPQGGVISPLLANAVLNKLDWFLHSKGAHGPAKDKASARREPNVRFSRYADDWCVFLTRAPKQYAEALREEIRGFLRRECDLELSVEKTHVTHVRDGFDFLGFRLSHDIGKSGERVPKINIGQKALRNVRERLNEAMRHRPHQESVALRLQRGSAVVRGWSEYFRVAHDFSHHAGKLDHFTFWTALKAICRKNDISTGQAMKQHYRNSGIQVDTDCRLAKFSDSSMKMYCEGPKPYRPGQNNQESDEEMAAKFLSEGRRPGNADVRYKILQRDRYCCRRCGRFLTAKDAIVDHLIPVKRFANYALASTDDNLQTLCVDCHKEKHNAK